MATLISLLLAVASLYIIGTHLRKTNSENYSEARNNNCSAADYEICDRL